MSLKQSLKNYYMEKSFMYLLRGYPEEASWCDRQVQVIGGKLKPQYGRDLIGLDKLGDQS